MPICYYACNTAEHVVSRRAFLGAAGAAAALGPGGVRLGREPTRSSKRTQKRVLVIFLSGGVSQLETWDPKPNTDTGGPFKAIPTSVPGTHICELLPHTAKQVHRLAIVRGLNSQSDDHGIGTTIMLTGRKPEPGITYPHLGAVAARLLGSRRRRAAGPHPDSAEGRQRLRRCRRRVPRARSTPRYASATASRRPISLRPKELAADSDAAREAFRKKLNDRFAKSRKSAATDAYAESFEQAERVVKQGDVFDIEKESLEGRGPVRPARLRPAPACSPGDCSKPA